MSEPTHYRGRRLAGLGVLLAVLAAGGVGGYALGVRRASSGLHPQVELSGPDLAWPAMESSGLLPALLEEIGATEEQRSEIQKIVDRLRPQTDSILRRSFPALRAISDSMDREIRAVLTPAQRERLQRSKLDPLEAPAPIGPGQTLPRGVMPRFPPPESPAAPADSTSDSGLERDRTLPRQGHAAGIAATWRDEQRRFAGVNRARRRQLLGREKTAHRAVQPLDVLGEGGRMVGERHRLAGGNGCPLGCEERVDPGELSVVQRRPIDRQIADDDVAR